MRYLEYKSLLKLLKLLFRIDIKRPILTKICKRYIKGCL